METIVVGSFAQIFPNTMYSLFSLYSNSSSNSSSNSTVQCSKFLLETSLSRETNGTYQYGLCPDTYVSFALCLAFLLIYMTTVGLSGLGVIWKRKSGHIQARNPVYLFFTLGAGFVFIVGMTLRIIIGRKVCRISFCITNSSAKIYPCGLLTIFFFTLPPG